MLVRTINGAFYRSSNLWHSRRRKNSPTGEDDITKRMIEYGGLFPFKGKISNNEFPLSTWMKVARRSSTATISANPKRWRCVAPCGNRLSVYRRASTYSET